MMIAKTSLILKQIKQDLLPFKFRLSTSWRIALLCSLMAGIAMLYEIPESAISCYLILYLVKTDAVENILLCVGVIILCSIVVCITFILYNLTMQHIMLRFFFMALFSGFFMYLSSASSLGDIGNLIALVIAFLMTLIDDIPIGDIATRLLLYALLMAVSPMLLVIIFNYFFGISPRKILLNKLSERFLSTSHYLLESNIIPSFHVSEALSTQAECKRYLSFIKLFYLKERSEIKQLEILINNSYEILIFALSLPSDTSPEIRKVLAEKCELIAKDLSNYKLDKLEELKLTKSEQDKNALLAEFNAILFKVDMAPTPKTKMPFFVEDAFTNPNHKYFAIKTTCAALICYLFYDYFDWQGIHTAMITCYVVALTTVGETVHKLTLRIIGCLIGAFIGIISLIYIIPNLSDIGSLMVLIFFCILPAAWVASGNDRISYAGVQVGLAFLLTVLHGFKPSFDMDVASDRILGILVGNVVMYIMFTKVWPVSIMTTINKQIKNILNNYATLKLKTNNSQVEALNLVALINEDIIKSKDDINLLIFETKFKDKNSVLIHYFNQLLVDILADSYHYYSAKFISNDETKITNNPQSEQYFKYNVLNSVPTTLSAQEKEQVIHALIDERSNHNDTIKAN